MKKIVVAALVAAQVSAAAQPAFAAELIRDGSYEAQQRGAFAGARIHIPLSGATGEKARVGLALAPVLRNQSSGGAIRTRFTEGMEFGLSGKNKMQLSLAGRPLSQLTEGRAGPDGRKMGLSSVGWVAIGIGVAAVIAFAAYAKIGNDASE